MNTNRCVKWSEDALNFLRATPDNSVVLDSVISLACHSQSGEGFKEFVNSINSKEIKKKSKKSIFSILLTYTDIAFQHLKSIQILKLQQNGFLKTKILLDNYSANMSLNLGQPAYIRMSLKNGINK